MVKNFILQVTGMGGQGNLDIYVSEKDATGDWGPAVNLGASLNTPFNEDTPFYYRE